MIQPKITVVDSLMGEGKTSWAIQYVNSNINNNFLYITPLLSECTRIVKSAKRDFKEPKHRGKGKLNDLKDLLKKEKDIASTHALFLDFDKTVRDILTETKYTLILDETVNAIVPFNQLVEKSQRCGKGDIHHLTKTQTIKIDNQGFVYWVDNPADEELDCTMFQYAEVKKFSKQHTLIAVNEQFFVWQYPSEIFELFDEVYILTYLFEGSILSGYFAVNGIDYIKKSVVHRNGEYSLIKYFEPDTSRFRTLIHIYDGDMNTNYNLSKNLPPKRTSLSKKWYDSRNRNSPEIKQLRNNMKNFFCNKKKAKINSILWTSYTDDYNKLKNNGYSGKKGNKKPDELPVPFLAVNARASNEYSTRNVLGYMVNRYLNVGIKEYFNSYGLEFDEDKYALAEMLQWIWRSAIRNNEPIEIYIPSIRMRELLLDWLYPKMDEN